MDLSPEAGQDTWVGEFPPTVTVTKPVERPALSEPSAIGFNVALV